MSTLLTIQNLTKGFGSENLFENLSFSISQKDRIGLIGPNGAGKSTLLKIIMGLEEADEGSICQRQGVKIAYASQSPSFSSQTVEMACLEAIASDMQSQARIEAHILLSKAEFQDFGLMSSTLSGGWKKRLDLVRALMHKPDILLLDEPTNHLDLEGIFWLEKFLHKERIALFIVSHDRQFLQNMCNKIFDLNPLYPDGIFISEGDLKGFYEKKEQFLQGQLERERSLKNSVKEEIEWLRRSPKARTTKSISRVSRAQRMIEELSHIKNRNHQKKVSISFSASQRQTRKLICAHNIGKSLSHRTLFEGVDLILSPGTRLGIVGKNGTGKSTLMKILSGKILQDKGTLKYADDLKLVYFDQHREQLPGDLTLKEALCDRSEMVEYMGQQIHVNGWAARFLFPPERLSIPIRCLSGGERARILIAKLMLKPADVLFLDEPTNDLDIPTLEVMEESLKNFPGAVVIISHDRELMINLCTEILSLGGAKDPQTYSGYMQWESAQMIDLSSSKEPEMEKKSPSPPSATKKRLSYLEQKEYDEMEKKIEQAEEKIHSILKQLENDNTLEKSTILYQQLAEEQERVDLLFSRWDVLSKKIAASENR